jgi:hypothetical protein
MLCTSAEDAATPCQRSAVVLFQVINTPPMPRCEEHAVEMRSALRNFLQLGTWRETSLPGSEE